MPGVEGSLRAHGEEPDAAGRADRRSRPDGTPFGEGRPAPPGGRGPGPRGADVDERRRNRRPGLRSAPGVARERRHELDGRGARLREPECGVDGADRPGDLGDHGARDLGDRAAGREELAQLVLGEDRVGLVLGVGEDAMALDLELADAGRERRDLRRERLRPGVGRRRRHGRASPSTARAIAANRRKHEVAPGSR